MSTIKEISDGNVTITVPITCPECYHITHELISKIQETEVCICAGCGNETIITNDGLMTLISMTNVLEELKPIPFI
jgi:NMD protein affecting ribosome stability and mRNA decay